MADTLKASESGITLVDRARQCQKWNRTAEIWLQTAHVAQSTLNRFWAKKPIQRDSFIAICQAVDVDWTEVADPNFSGSIGKARDKKPPESIAPRDPCLGREDILHQWQARSPLRLIMVVGITGIGKTVLAQQWMIQSKEKYDHCVAINFESRARTRFTDVATFFLSQLHPPIAVTSPDVEHLLEQWLTVLAEQPYLVVMDSLEEILVGNEQNGWSQFQDESWERFFHRFLGLDQCASSIVITSQDIPAQLEVHGLRYGDRFHSEVLLGLAPEAQHQFFQRYGIWHDTDRLCQDYLMRIGSAYEGHPLALRVITGDILSQAQGSVVTYWEQYGCEIEALERLRSPSIQDIQPHELRLDRYCRRLRRAVRERIEHSLTRLRTDIPDAYLLLCMAAVYRESVTEAFLLRPLTQRGWDEQRSLIALDTLLDRCLLELDKTGCFRLHNLVRSVVLDHLQGLAGVAS